MKNQNLSNCMKNSLLFLAGLSLSLIMFACDYDNEEDLYPDNCDLTTVTYSQTIAPLVITHCMDVLCHGGEATESVYPFATYDGLKAVVNNERLMGALKHEPGFSFMPKNTASLSACDIDRFQKWVDDGAPNN